MGLSYAQEQKRLGMFRAVPYSYDSDGRQTSHFGGGGGYGGAACKFGAVGNYKRATNTFATTQFEFCLDTCEARSYRWWVFVLRVGNVIYFNNASYSPQTDDHQHMARNILAAEGPQEHGLTVKYVKYREGLNHMDEAARNRRAKIIELQEAIANPLSRPATNAKRRARIAELQLEIAECKRLAPIFNKQIKRNKEIKDLANGARELNRKKLDLIEDMRKELKRETAKPVLRNSSYVALALERYNETKKNSFEYHVMSLAEFRARDLSAFAQHHVFDLRPVAGRSRQEAVTNLTNEVNVAFVTARVQGEAEPDQFKVI